ncbi:MAG: exo-alpha-sialidase [Clostridia bacterium]|nr:exo-alpha-sialidase [Clostridia bacterium]
MTKYYRSEEITSLVLGNPETEGTDYSAYRVPGIVVSKKGTVLAYWENRNYDKNRKGSNGDECLMDITVRRSVDSGKSFSEPIYIARGEEYYQNGRGETLNNPVMIVGDDGRLHFLFCCDVGRQGAFYTYSDDDGVTWSNPRDIKASLNRLAWDSLGFGPGHGICIQNGAHKGRLIVSAWIHRENEAIPGGHVSLYCTATHNTTVYSDDNGETWQMGEEASENRDETSIVELSDGSVMINSRQHTFPFCESIPKYIEAEARRAVTVSANGVDHWSKTRYDDTLIDPACEGNICAANVEGLPRAILFSNCASTTKRFDLTVRCSFDDAKTWLEKTVYLGHIGWYSDIAVDQNGKVYVIHENAQITGGKKMCTELFTFSFYDQFVKNYIEEK